MASFAFDCLEDMPATRQFLPPQLKDPTFQPTSHDKEAFPCFDDQCLPSQLDGVVFSTLNDMFNEHPTLPRACTTFEDVQPLPLELYPLSTNPSPRGSNPLKLMTTPTSTQSILQLSSSVDTAPLPTITVEDLAVLDNASPDLDADMMMSSDDVWCSSVETDMSGDELSLSTSCDIPYVPASSPATLAQTSPEPTPSNRVESKFQWNDALLTMSRRDFSRYTRTNKDRLSKDALDDLRKTRRRMKNRLYQKDARDRQCLKTFKQCQ
jgi:hypothetical protein